MPIRSRFISLYHPTIFIERASLLQIRRVMAFWQKLLALLFNLLAVCRWFRWIHQSFRVDVTSNYWKTKGFWWEIKGSVEIVTASATYRSGVGGGLALLDRSSFLSLFSTCTQRLFRTQLKKNHFRSVFFFVFFSNRTTFPMLSCTPSSKNLISVPDYIIIYNKSTRLPKSV